MMETALLVVVALNFALEVAAFLYRRKLRRDRERVEREWLAFSPVLRMGMGFVLRLQRDADREPDPARAVVLRRAAADVAVIVERVR